MDVRDFRVMIQKYAPWLLKRIVGRIGRFKLSFESDGVFERNLFAKIRSIQELPLKDLTINQTICSSTPSVDGDMITSRCYEVVWRKNNEEDVRHIRVDTHAGLSVGKLIDLVFYECRNGDTPWIEAILEVVYTINIHSTDTPKHSFIVYPYEERAFMSWVDQHKDEINKILAQRGLTLSSYTVVAL